MFIQEADAATVDDLAPGGRIAIVPEPTEEKETPLTEDAFKTMLAGRATNASAYSATSGATNASANSASTTNDAPPASVTSVSTPAIDGMPLKELRRLGEQRGIVGAADMRKKELLTALRHQVLPIVPAANSLDLDAVEAQGIEGIEDIVEPPVEQEAQILE
jgi:hypothetical protein